jgi:ribonuclease T1
VSARVARCVCSPAAAIRAIAALLLFTVLGLGLQADAAREKARDALPHVALEELPPEARQTIRLIRGGGPFPYERDGSVFGNFERLLPHRERGYYRAYTVKTPGLAHRGARRIVAGRGGELYYTDDHYRTFRRVRE